MTNTFKWRLSAFLAVASILSTLIIPAVRTDALTGSSLSLSDPRSAQTGVNYTFNTSGFTTGTTIKCIELKLNASSDGTGSAVGTTTGSTLVSSTAITAGSWTINNTTNGTLKATNVTGQAPAANGNIVFGNITNGASEGVTYYGIFKTYTDTNCTTPAAGVDSVTVAYVLKNGALVQLTIDPTLTFTCSSVSSGQTVNSATTTVASTCSGINFGTAVTAAVNGISAHDLNVTTNAAGGYTINIRHTGQLTNGTANIANFGSTNAAPTAFSAVGVEAWGYTTQDATLAGGTAARFTATGGNKWAGFTTSNAPVADNTVFTAGSQTTRVGQQVAIAAATPAGTYQTTIIYTVASTY